ncbi:hypothetical protein [Aliiglaciecola litoralis]|uniref:Helix-turn-helix domain-containing protein n=1 Tax=Aliiglaciecola litoralis TaxID=582857 RepID=A0ABP3X3A4_9ALTE
MQNHEDNIINYIEGSDHTDDDKAIFFDYLTKLYSHCHEDCGSDSPKTLKQLFPIETWENIDGHNRNTLGKHVRHLVKLDGLPLTEVGKTSENHCLYIINKQGE